MPHSTAGHAPLNAHQLSWPRGCLNRLGLSSHLLSPPGHLLATILIVGRVLLHTVCCGLDEFSCNDQALFLRLIVGNLLHEQVATVEIFPGVVGDSRLRGMPTSHYPVRTGMDNVRMVHLQGFRRRASACGAANDACPRVAPLKVPCPPLVTWMKQPCPSPCCGVTSASLVTFAPVASTTCQAQVVLVGYTTLCSRDNMVYCHRYTGLFGRTQAILATVLCPHGHEWPQALGYSRHRRLSPLPAFPEFLQSGQTVSTPLQQRIGL